MKRQGKKTKAPRAFTVAACSLKELQGMYATTRVTVEPAKGTPHGEDLKRDVERGIEYPPPDVREVERWSASDSFHIPESHLLRIILIIIYYCCYYYYFLNFFIIIIISSSIVVVVVVVVVVFIVTILIYFFNISFQ